MQTVNLSDQEIMQLILNEKKHSVTSLAHYALEASTPEVRSAFLSAMQTCLNHHHQVWNAMYKRNWYTTTTASQQEITNTQNMMAQVLGQGMQPAMQQQVQPGQTLTQRHNV